MLATKPRRTLVGLILAMLVFVPCAVDATGHAGTPTLQAPASSLTLNLAAQAWSWLKGLLPDAGCRLDPNGLPCTAGAARALLRPDEGCRADPNGQCLPSAIRAPIRADEGCRADPDGHCLPSAVQPSANRPRR
jgi:hypothetical protein